LVLATAYDHPLGALKTASFEQTIECDYVSLVSASALHTFLTKVAAGLHKTLKVRVQVSNFEALCRLIETNVGIGILPASAANRHSKSMNIRPVELTDPWAIRNMQICVLHLHSLPIFTRDLVEMLIMDAKTNAAPELS
jgi:DNA-binding transcriptional LysR family regulator